MAHTLFLSIPPLLTEQCQSLWLVVFYLVGFYTIDFALVMPANLARKYHLTVGFNNEREQLKVHA